MENEKLTRKQVSNYTLDAIAILAGVVIIACGSSLSLNYIIVIVVISTAIIPFVIKVWIKQKRSINKFEHLCNYLTNIIPIFIQKTKIRFTLGELYAICDDEVKDAIGKSINYIDETRNDPKLLTNALKIIEDRFNNSRIESVHKFILSVENNNSLSYKDIADNLNKDIEEWIKRTHSFQKDLKNRKIKILFLCISTLLMNVMFTYVYTSNEYFAGYVNNPLYQISTFMFIIFVLFVIALIVIKLNGEWLIEDTKSKNEEKLKDKYRRYKKGKEKIKALDILISLIVIALGIYFFIVDDRIVAYAFYIIAIIFISQKSRRYKSLKRYIRKELTIEFPMWLREVSLSLGNLTVLNAIENSENYSSYALRREIRYFLRDASKNPISIQPYNDFLKEYEIDEVKSSMRVLYAVNNVSKKEMRERVAKLIDRNQDLLAKSEKMRNYDSISGIEMIGYLPTIIFCVHMMLSMLIMFDFMMDSLSSVI